jgi:RNA polymerase sigma-70 factor (ECF subfamily)
MNHVYINNNRGEYNMKRDLIIKSQKGDIEAFEELIKEHKKYAYNIALKILKNKEDAEDISQEALIKVYENIKSFNMNSSFKTWMYKIVFNTCIDFKRKKRLKTSSLDEPIHYGYDDIPKQIEDNEKNPEKLLTEKLNVELVRDSIDELEDDFKNVIILRDIQGFKYKEIAEILDCNQGTVKSRISRGREKLKEIIIQNM